MSSTYSDLKIELIGTGEQSGTWGTTTNTNLGTAIEEAITGSEDVSFFSADVTLTLTDTNTSQAARNLRLNLTGTSGGPRNLVVPAIEKVYIVNNGLANAVTVKNSSGTGISVPAGKTMYLYNDSTNVVDAITHLSSLTLATDLAVADGGTGASDPATARTNLGLGSMAVQNATAINVSGGTIGGTTIINTSGTATFLGTATATTQPAGDNSTKLATTAFVSSIQIFVTGMIMLWSGSTGTIPTGWRLCDGGGGTPDLRNRFVVGAGSSYGVGAAGGSADATLPFHSHTAATSVATRTGLTGSLNLKNRGGSLPNNSLMSASSGSVSIAAGNQGSTGEGWDGGSGGGSSKAIFTLDHDHPATTSVNSSGVSATNANLPPYYALCYIMKT